MVRRARRNVVQWTGGWKSASLGLGNPSGPKKSDKAKKKSSGGGQPGSGSKAKKPRPGAAPVIRIEQVPSGWRARCGCGWTTMPLSKSKAHGAGTDHTHTRKITQPSPKKGSTKPPPARRPAPKPSTNQKASVPGPDQPKVRKRQRPDAIKVKKEGSTWLWWCIRCGDFRKGLPSESSARNDSSRHKCR